MKIEIEKAYIEFNEDICEENTIEVAMVYVPEESRGKKIGYKLLAKVEEWARKNGFEQLSLCAYPQEDNGMTSDDLVEYYNGFGFEQFEGSEIMYMAI